MLKRFYRALPVPVRSLMTIAFDGALAALPARQRVMLTYYKSFGRFPDLRQPKLYSEKLQARKLSGENLGGFIDKIAVKDFVSRRCGDICIPTLYAGDQLPPIGKRNWPLPFVIKTSHGSGGNIFVRKAPNWDAVEAHLKTLLAHRHGRMSGELFYLTVPPRVLVEPLIGGGELPVDYKFYVVGGEVAFAHVDQGREHDHRRVFYSPEWERLPIRDGKRVGDDAPKPSRLADMVKIARALGQGFGFVRVDLYEVAGRIYFGELTFAPEAGYMKFDPPEIDAQLGAMWG